MASPSPALIGERSTRTSAKDRRRRQILIAARKLLKEKGHPDIAMRALAELAGVSIMTLYNLIGGRDEILTLLVKDETVNSLSKIKWHRTATAIESVLAIPGHYFEYLATDPDYLRLLNTIFLSPAATNVRGEIIAPRRAWWTSLVSNAQSLGEISPSVNVGLFVLNLESLLSGALRAWSADGVSTPAAAAKLKYGFALALLGVATPKARPVVEAFLERAQRELLERSDHSDAGLQLQSD